jgi:uncharacterized protein (TIGR00255 family)
MTGFGEARHEEGALAVAVEVRAINNRYLKLSLRASDAYSSLEPQIEALVRKHVKRGTVQVNIRVAQRAEAEEYPLNRAALESYHRQLQTLKTDWGMAGGINPEALLHLPGVVDESATRRVDLDHDWPIINGTLEEALTRLGQMRAEEGAALASDLKSNCLTIAGELDKIEARLPQLVHEYRDRLLERVNRTLEKYDVTIQAADVVREISLYAERSDVSEEIVRLRSHLEQFDAVMALDESSGRKLEFLTQEMFREANTIGSKASDVEIPQHVIEIKTAIERIREQVQNVE